jgi:hypothetical protein
VFRNPGLEMSGVAEGLVCPPFVEEGLSVGYPEWQPSAVSPLEQQARCRHHAVVRPLTKCQTNEITATIKSA